MRSTGSRKGHVCAKGPLGLALLVGALVCSAMMGAGPAGLVPQPAIAQAAEGQGLLLLKAKGDESLSEELVARVKTIARGAQVERYLSLKAQPHEVIGIEPEGPARIIQGDKVLTAKLERGRWFKSDDRNVAVVGEVYREDYVEGMPGHGMGTPHGMMKHPFEIGSTFTRRESPQRLRVIGEFTAQPKAAAAKVLLPLGTAQKLFNKEGVLSHLVVIVKPAEQGERVSGELTGALGETIETIPQR